MSLDEGAVTTGAVSKVLTVLPIGVTVAIGSVCILDTEFTIGGTATVGNTCVRMPASTGCMTAGTVFLIDVLSSPVCTKAWDRAVEVGAIPAVVCWVCMVGPGVDTETICWTGEECKGGVPAATGAATEERGAGIDRLGKTQTDREDRGADTLDKVGATAGEMVNELSACVVVPVANLIVPCAEPRAGALDATEETRAGTLPNLGGAETKEGEPMEGDVKLQACVAGNLGRADTTFVLLGNKAELRPGVPVSWTGVTLGVVASNDAPTDGVHATKGQLTAGTPGSLAGDWGKTGA